MQTYIEPLESPNTGPNNPPNIEDGEEGKPIRPRKQRAAIFYELAQRHGSYEFIHEGERKTLRQWALVSKVPLHNLYQRIYILGWNIGQAISIPVHGRRTDGLGPGAAPPIDREGKGERKPKPKLEVTPFISEGVYAAYITIEGQDTQVTSDLQYDFEGGVWYSLEFPMCRGASRDQVCLMMMSLYEDGGGMAIDKEEYLSLTDANLKFQFKRV